MTVQDDQRLALCGPHRLAQVGRRFGEQGDDLADMAVRGRRTDLERGGQALEGLVAAQGAPAPAGPDGPAAALATANRSGGGGR
ncbi:hypothetical protein E1287_00920 [Actinomadura sp. KC06]|uniref:hypothetical protein n=1 Tax=Actinomadura sp. KC06 TaxID=2530369 RepID=UPI0010483EF4|nr:hypothetical protein [Actinomadura sp. KC06]TDD40565.1 hypothetical protein E1287_00920 [Actinomadura sp. KC06]